MGSGATFSKTRLALVRPATLLASPSAAPEATLRACSAPGRAPTRPAPVGPNRPVMAQPNRGVVRTAQWLQARRHAIDRMVANATAMGANAVVMMRFDSSEIGQTMSEIVAYGTAVVVEADPSATVAILE